MIVLFFRTIPRLSSTHRWRIWHFLQDCNIWHWGRHSTRVWSTWSGRAACRASLLVFSSTRIWSMLCGPTVWEAWLLVHFSSRIWRTSSGPAICSRWRSTVAVAAISLSDPGSGIVCAGRQFKPGSLWLHWFYMLTWFWAAEKQDVHKWAVFQTPFNSRSYGFILCYTIQCLHYPMYLGSLSSTMETCLAEVFSTTIWRSWHFRPACNTSPWASWVRNLG